MEWPLGGDRHKERTCGTQKLGQIFSKCSVIRNKRHGLGLTATQMEFWRIVDFWQDVLREFG